MKCGIKMDKTTPTTEMKTVMVGTWLTPDMCKQMDEKIGMIPRSVYVRSLIEKDLKA